MFWITVVFRDGAENLTKVELKFLMMINKVASLLFLLVRLACWFTWHSQKTFTLNELPETFSKISKSALFKTVRDIRYSKVECRYSKYRQDVHLLIGSKVLRMKHREACVACWQMCDSFWQLCRKISETRVHFRQKINIVCNFVCNS